MLWNRRPRQTEFRLFAPTEALYIGLGDQFDDERRVVRVIASVDDADRAELEGGAIDPS